MRIDFNRRRATAAVVCAAVLALLMPSLHAATDRDGGVTLAAASVAASGIATATLQATQQTDQALATVSVRDPQPLLALAAELQTAQADAVAATIAAHAANLEAKRTQALYRDHQNASLQQVQAAAVTAANAHAQQVIAQARERAARGRVRTQWGTTLTAVVANDPGALDAYIEGRRALLEVVLPADSPEPGATITLSLPGRGTLQAQRIGASPRADAVVQGATYFYRAAAAGLRTNQRLTASVPLGGAARTGVMVPAAAVVWYAGQPWAYVETAAGHYRRRPLVAAAAQNDGWFQAHGFRAGEPVVVRGGELLLAQELMPPPGATPPAGDGDGD